MSWLRKHYLIVLVLILALFFRLYNLPATVTFLEDEGRDLLIMHRMIDQGRPVLLGPQTSTGNMYLGPLYYYLVTPALFLAQMNPLGPVVFIALTGVLTVWLLYIFGSKWFGTFVGTSSALMYAILPLPVSFTRNSWNPNLAPLFALLIIWCLINIIEKKSHAMKQFLLLGLFAGALIQMHYMALLFLVGVGAAIALYLRKAIPTLLKGTVTIVLGVALSLLPFIVFEIRNDFVNTRAITRFVEAKEEHNIRYSLPLSLWSDKVGMTSTRLFSSLFGRDALTPDPRRVVVAITIALVLLGGSLSHYKKTDESSRIYKLIFIPFIIPLLLTGIYQENMHLHYLGFFFPLVYLLVAASLVRKNSIRLVSTLLVVACMVYGMPQLFSYLQSNGTNQVIRAREVAEYIAADAGETPYNMVSATGNPTAPYLYFANISDRPPTTELVTDLYLICQGEPCSDDDVSTPFIYITGPAHPTIEAYLGHPLIYHYEGQRELVSNEHVSHGSWVAKINVKMNP
jgi:4-amino-4-deoxy-L-arabinose transferase-like glycosyltransferase